MPTRNISPQTGLLGARRHRKTSAMGMAMAKVMHNAKNRSDVRGNKISFRCQKLRGLDTTLRVLTLKAG
jgi:hypothetical protein